MTIPRLRRRYHAALRSLPAPARRVFRMHRIQDLAIVEIAIRLDLDHEAVEELLAEAIVAIDLVLAEPDRES